MLVGKVRNVGRLELGLNGDLHVGKGSVLVGEGLVESESEEARLSVSLVVSELGLVFSVGSGLSSVVNPLNTDGDLGKQFVAFGGLHEFSEVTALGKFGLHLVSVAFELVSDLLPVKELTIVLVEGQLLLA